MTSSETSINTTAVKAPRTTITPLVSSIQGIENVFSVEIVGKHCVIKKHGELVWTTLVIHVKGDIVPGWNSNFRCVQTEHLRIFVREKYMEGISVTF